MEFWVEGTAGCLGENGKKGSQPDHGELVSQSSGLDFVTLADAGPLLDSRVPSFWSESHCESS